MDIESLKQAANNIRRGVVVSTYNAKSGHPGGSLSCADIMAYLYFMHRKRFSVCLIAADKQCLGLRFLVMCYSTGMSFVTQE